MVNTGRVILRSGQLRRRTVKYWGQINPSMGSVNAAQIGSSWRSFHFICHLLTKIGVSKKRALIDLFRNVENLYPSVSCSPVSWALLLLNSWNCSWSEFSWMLTKRVFLQCSWSEFFELLTQRVLKKRIPTKQVFAGCSQNGCSRNKCPQNERLVTAHETTTKRVANSSADQGIQICDYPFFTITF